MSGLPPVHPEKPSAVSGPRVLPSLTAASLALVLILLTFVSRASRLVAPRASPPPAKCPHVVLFSSARHGSTWFIDSVERCRYSRSPRRRPTEPFDPDVFRATEPWKHPRSPIYALSGADTAHYVRANSSVKVFSSTMALNPQGVRDLVTNASALHLPFVILRREPRATFESLRVAKHSGIWNGMRNSSGLNDTQIGHLVDQEAFAKYKATMERHYQFIHGILHQARVTWTDTVDYDRIKAQKYIRLHNNNCYIRNCNF